MFVRWLFFITVVYNLHVKRVGFVRLFVFYTLVCNLNARAWKFAVCFSIRMRVIAMLCATHARERSCCTANANSHRTTERRARQARAGFEFPVRAGASSRQRCAEHTELRSWGNKSPALDVDIKSYKQAESELEASSTAGSTVQPTTSSYEPEKRPKETRDYGRVQPNSQHAHALKWLWKQNEFQQHLNWYW